MASEHSEQQTHSYELRSQPQSPTPRRSVSPSPSAQPDTNGRDPAAAITQPQHHEPVGLSSTVIGTIACRFRVRVQTRLAQACNTLKDIYVNKVEAVLKAATILSLLFTAVSIWPSISAASDGRTSKLIAEWTARKDFIENCEAHNWSSAACERSKGIQLDAPPNLDRSRWKRHLETDNLLSLITSTGVIALHPLLWIPISSSLLFIQMRRLVIRGSSQRPESSPVHTDDLTPAQEFGFYSAPAHGETSFNSESDPDESKPTPITRDYNLRPRPPRKAQNPALERASKQEPPPKPRADRTRPSNGPRTESKETRKAQNPAPERTSKRKPAPKPKTEGTNFPNGPRTESKETSQKASGVSPGNPILIWYCCQCGGGPMNVATNIHCFCYYQHQRCSYCCVEYSTTRNRMSRNR